MVQIEHLFIGSGVLEIEALANFQSYVHNICAKNQFTMEQVEKRGKEGVNRQRANIAGPSEAGRCR